MNITVKHNGTNITGFVTSYDRVHKICTGIGTLDIEIVDTITRTFKPWDEIDIWENGDFKVRYYVSSVEHMIPRGTLRLNCQDNSKRIVDYFIPQSYTIDYPSYNKYWIQTFLDEAGVEYEFTTSSPGTLLSNYTQLGLVTVYEQVLTLLQMSGWYMYFDGNGKAIIGSLNVDFADNISSVGKTDILDILVTSNDKMLRNKALVFGSYDGYTGANAKASVTVHTPWNYDHNDLRTVVISNSNIKDNGTAYSMANQIIKEFARITVEKHITVWGARNFNLGTALRVTSNVWKGRGLITTFGVSMSKQGLVTNIVLDERCPRLFGFFDFGDYVYVGFYGDGVWRKHIKYDPTWYNFSTGLTDMAITDLHINNGVFGAVGSSGGAFYAIDSLPWNPILVSGFSSSIDDVVDPAIIAASGEIPSKYFSGVMARAVTVDKYGNTVKVAYDTLSGLNMGDYFMAYSGILSSGFISGSGATSTTSGEWRSWIVEYDVLAGDVTGVAYPVSLSGHYGYTVVDLDNSGTNDYISVTTSGMSTPTVGAGNNFGYKISQPSHDTYDPHNIVSYNLYDDFDQPNETIEGSASTGTQGGIAVFNNESTGEREMVVVQNIAGVATVKRTSISKPSGTLTVNTRTSPSLGGFYPFITKTSTDNYNLYRLFNATPSAGNLNKVEVRLRTWDAAANTLGTETILGYVEVDDDATKSSSDEIVDFSTPMLINGVIYYVLVKLCKSNGTTSLTNYMKFYMLSCDTASNTVSGYLINRIDFETAVGGVSNLNWSIFALNGTIPYPRFTYQKGNYPSYAMYIREQHTALSPDLYRRWLVYSQYGGTFQKVLIQENDNLTDSDFYGTGVIADSTGAQFTNDRFILYARATNNITYVYDGDSVSIVTATSIPFTWKPSTTYPMFGAHATFYIAKNGTDYYVCDPASFTAAGLISFPTDYTPVKPFSTTDSANALYYWQLQNDITGFNEIHRYSTTGATGYKITPNGGFNFSESKGQIAGNFFIDYAGTTNSRWLYVDNEVAPTPSRIYQVLQRDGTEFKLIQQELYPIRLDVSGNNPVLTVGSGEPTFQSNYVYPTELVTVEAIPSGTVIPGSGRAVNDYRYTYLQPMLGTLTSGLGISSTILYVNGSGIYSADALSFSGGFTQMFSIPSGEALRIETSNYGIGGQYIFVSASGVMTASGQGQTFYQQDPAALIFYEHATNYPQSRATIIRLDDSI